MPQTISTETTQKASAEPPVIQPTQKSKTILWVILVTLTAIIFIGWVVWTYQKTINEADKLAQTPVISPHSTAFKFLGEENLADDCAALSVQIYDLLDEANYCQIDNDCLVHDDLICPFGCWRFINKNANLTAIKQSVEKYTKNCGPGCLYDCFKGDLNEIKCIDNECQEVAQVVFKGFVQEDLSPSPPSLNECSSAAYFIEIDDQVYYLANLCPAYFTKELRKLESFDEKTVFEKDDALHRALLNEELEIKGVVVSPKTQGLKIFRLLSPNFLLN